MEAPLDVWDPNGDVKVSPMTQRSWRTTMGGATGGDGGDRSPAIES